MQKTSEISVIWLVYPFIFKRSLTSKVFINIHETSDQKIRLHSYSTAVKETICYQFLHSYAISSEDTNHFEGVPFSYVFCDFYQIFYLNIDILESEKQMIHIYGFKTIVHSLSIHSIPLSASYVNLNVRYK